MTINRDCQVQRGPSKMKKTRYFTVVAASLALLGVTACTQVGAVPQPVVPVHVTSADLSSGVASVEELREVGQVGVIATATTSIQIPEPVDPEIVYTKQTFEINRTLWGSNLDTHLDVTFTGGTVDGESGSYLLQLEGQPQFESGRQYLLVLLGPAEDGTYMVLGGAQGRYEVVNGQLRGARTEDNVVSTLNGRAVDAAVEGLRAAAP